MPRQARHPSQPNGKEIQEDRTEADLAKAKEEGFLAASAEVIFPSSEPLMGYHMVAH
jgi:hypothetical protein